MIMSEEYDAIVVGGGPNGLTCSAYLAKAGAKVLLVEKRCETGGGLYTEELNTPFRFNSHAFYMLLGERVPAHNDLHLQTHVKYIRPEAQTAFLYKDKKSLVFYTDIKKSLKSISAISPQDAKTFENMHSEFEEMFLKIILPQTYVSPLPILELADLLSKTPLGKRLLDISELSPKELIESYGFKDPRIQAAVLYLSCIFGIHPELGGTGYLAPLYFYGMTHSAIVQGGSHSLSSAIQGSIMANGGSIRDASEVEKIVMSNGKAVGVKLKNGDEFRGKAIVSTLNPEQTFLDFVGEKLLPEDLANSVKDWEWEEWSLFTYHLGIKGQPPRFSAGESNPDVNSALTVVVGYESPDDVVKHVKEATSGKLPTVAGHFTCVTSHDPSQASSGPIGPLHTLRWESWAPYKLEQKHWDDLKYEYGQRIYDTLQEYAPNLKEAKILYKFAYSPLDIERRFPDMKRGSFKQGAYISTQMGYLRPNDTCSNCSTPIEGLYIGGASVYPGGMITLGPGYLAANAVTKDLGLKKWWDEPDYVKSARESGYLL